jgi:hypothetical protein
MSNEEAGPGQEPGAEFNQNLKLHMATMDAKYETPSEAAKRGHEALDKAGLSPWEMTCFAVELIGQVALTLQDQEVIGYAKKLSNVVYNLHYHMDGVGMRLRETGELVEVEGGGEG